MWKTLPIVEHHSVHPSQAELEQVDQLAQQLRAEHLELNIPDHFRALMVDNLQQAPSLHVDDLSDIAMLDQGADARFLQDRARLRAGDGDYVASCSPRVDGFEQYCRDRLGLGSCAWIHPSPARNPMQLAAACWEDAQTRAELVEAFRTERILYIHPHMGTLVVWELATLLQEESRSPIQVIAPPPGLTHWVNNKVLFAHTVNRLLGDSAVPCTNEAFNLTNLAKRVDQTADSFRSLVLKVPNSAGGSGNLVLDAEPFTRLSLREIRDQLRTLLKAMNWDDQAILLIGCWESEVLASPSTQVWIPPESSGPPIVEGVYEQILEGRECAFVGSQPADFPDHVTQELTHRSWLLGRLFQRLGYVGRCSFDLLLVGDRIDHSRIEFVECNGRWGGTSMPMTFMNRLFGDWRTQAYATRICEAQGLNQLSFGAILDRFQEDLFDVQTRRGRLILYNPGRIRSRSGIDVIALGNTPSEATQLAQEWFPERLQRLTAESTGA